MGAQSEHRGGQFGNTRGKPDKQNRRRAAREARPRVQQATAATRAHQARIDALASRSEATAGTQGKLVYDLVVRRQEEIRNQPRPVVPEPAVDHAAELARVREVLAEQSAPAPVVAPKLAADPIEWYGEGATWTLREASDMLSQGYPLRTVVRRTGWGAAYFTDLVDWLDDDPEAQAVLIRIRAQLY